MERAVVGMLIRPQKTFDERTPACCFSVVPAFVQLVASWFVDWTH
jgi:hypothetical protein